MKQLIKSLLNGFGYHVFKEGFLPRGIYLDSDLKRVIHLNQVKTVMDVGACEGGMTGYFLKIFPNARLIAVEPSPESYSRLKDIYSTTRRVELKNLGAGRKNGNIEFSLFENRELNTFKSIQKDEAFPISSRIVEVKTIADILQTSTFEMSEIDFLKIDVEGFETECLAGCEALLRENKIGMIFIESGFCSDDERHTPFQTIHDYVGQFGFSFFGLYDCYHHRKATELMFANALFLNEGYIRRKSLLDNLSSISQTPSGGSL